MSKVTFPVLRALGARALQYYCVLSSPSEEDVLDELKAGAELLGMPQVRDARTMNEHPALDSLLTQLASVGVGPYPATRIDEAISIAIRRGFATRGASPTTLRRWARDVEQEYGLTMPEPWKRSLKRWMRKETTPVKKGGCW